MTAELALPPPVLGMPGPPTSGPVAAWLSLPPTERRRAFDQASPRLRQVLLAAQRTALLHHSPGTFAHVLSGGRHAQPAHLRLVDDAYRAAAEQGGQRILVTMPPRHGKSERSSRWGPAWWLARYPASRVLLASYAAELATGASRFARDVLKEHGPGFGVTVRRDSTAADRWQTTAGGGMLAVGVGGGATGWGADLLVIDDPVKNREEAESEPHRKRVWDWWTSVAYTRLHPGASVVVVLTRWHKDDLAGRLLADQPGRWTVLSLPALSEGPGDLLGRPEGEPLWPARYDQAALLDIRTTVGARDWAALYQQRPTPAEGGLWTHDLLDAARHRPAFGPPVRRVVAVDPSASGGTGTDECGIVAAEIDALGRVTVLADRSGRMAPDVWARQAWQLVLDVEAHELVWEQNLAAGAMKLTLQQGWKALVADEHAAAVAAAEQAGEEPPEPADRPQPRMKPVTAKGDKAFRASPVVQAYREGRVRHDVALPVLEEQLVTWQPGQSSPDRLDALVHAVTDLLGGRRGTGLGAFPNRR